QRLACLAGVHVLRLVGEPAPASGHVAVAEAVVVQALAADDEQHRLLALLTQQRQQLLGGAQHVGVVPTAEALVTGDHQHGRPTRVLPLGQQRVVQRRRGRRQLGEHVGDLRVVRPSRLDPGLCLGDARGGDQLHRLGDLADGLGRLDPGTEFAKLRAHLAHRPLRRTVDATHATVFHHFGAGLATFRVSCPTLSSSIASASASTNGVPSEVTKPFLNSLVTSTRRAAFSSVHLPVSRISARMPSCLCRTCSTSSALKRRTSSTGTSSKCPLVPRYTVTTCSSTGIGEYSRCLSTSYSRAPRSSWRFDASSRSEANAANASSSRYCDRSIRSEPATSFIALTCASPPTRDTEIPTSMAGR